MILGRENLPAYVQRSVYDGENREKWGLQEMDRDVAELLMKKLVALNQPLGEVIETIHQISDAEEQNLFIKEVGKIMGDLFKNLTIPVARQYPDLWPADIKPSKDWWKTPF